MERQLAGATAVITGASRGIGAMTAALLSRHGVRIALVARTESELARVAAQLDTESVVIPADVTDPSSAERIADGVAAEFGMPPDILVNNAGLFRVAALSTVAPEEAREVVTTNLLAPLYFTRAFLPRMLERGSGDIVTIGSTADRNVFASNAAYAASKHGVRAMHEVLRLETRGTGVRATLISPASVDTAAWTGIDTESEASEFPPRSRMLRPAAIAELILFAVTRPLEVTIDEMRVSRS